MIFGRSYKGTDFLKFGNKGGDEIFFLEREGDCLERGGFVTFILNFHTQKSNTKKTSNFFEFSKSFSKISKQNESPISTSRDKCAYIES